MSLAEWTVDMTTAKPTTPHLTHSNQATHATRDARATTEAPKTKTAPSTQDDDALAAALEDAYDNVACTD
jgi:hypothetical protein